MYLFFIVLIYYSIHKQFVLIHLCAHVPPCYLPNSRDMLLGEWHRAAMKTQKKQLIFQNGCYSGVSVDLGMFYHYHPTCKEIAIGSNVSWDGHNVL